MASSIGSITRNGLSLLGKSAFQQLVNNVAIKRYLYAPSALGINGYLNARVYVKSQFANVEDTFFNKMRDFVEKKEDSIVFTEDLKTMFHLIEKKPEDLDLMYKMMIKFNNQSNLRFGNFVFGTVAMRVFYHLDEPELALKAFNDPQLNGFFDQIMTWQILMDLLYNHEKYAEVRSVYDTIKTKNIHGIVHPKNPFILVMGACYQENTPESLEYAIELFKEVQSRGFDVPRRAITFFGGLALKQNVPEVALESTSIARNLRYIDIRCIKIEAYAALKRIHEITVHFRSSLYDDVATRRKQSYFKDTIEKVEALIKNENLDETHDLTSLLDKIKIHDFIQPGSLHDHLSQTIEQLPNLVKKPLRKGFDSKYGFQHQENFETRRPRVRFNDRPGLRESLDG